MGKGYWLDYKDVDITGGFWQKRQRINYQTTIWAVKEQYQKSHRFEALRCERKKWQFYKPKPHIYWDSDVAKWIESAAYVLAKNKDAVLEGFVDELVEHIVENQWQNGYINSYFSVMGRKKVFRNVDNHELYCAGHLIEAAVAYYESTGKRKLLDAVIRYADLIYDIFYVKNSAGFSVCGHAEIELALVRLYECTGKVKYLELSRHFVYKKGTKEGQRGLPKVGRVDKPFGTLEYAQNHLPMVEQTTAEGHAVRAMYIYCAAADIAFRYDDVKLFGALDKIFDNIVRCKSYITGGIGSVHATESFGDEYYLPNGKAYAESCAAIGLVFFAKRMFLMKHDSKYTDMMETVLFNSFLSAIDLEGERFFYTNALEFDRKSRVGDKGWYPDLNRQKNFTCSCCPPNITRLIASLSGYVYAVDNNRTLYVNQYVCSRAMVGKTEVCLDTGYPYGEDVKISVRGSDEIDEVAVRIPNWCQEYTIEPDVKRAKDGYVYVETGNKDIDIRLRLRMDIRLSFSDERVKDNKGKGAFGYGAMVYCGEGIDNGDMDHVRINVENEYIEAYDKELEAKVISVKATKEGLPFDLRLIPYYTFNNRGESDMKVYFDIERARE